MERISDIKIILGLMLVQLAVCLPFIDSFPVALDEPFSIFWSQQPLTEMMSELANGNNTPLHFIVLKYWTYFVGISPVAVRSMSVFISLITIIPLFKLGKALMNSKYAILFLLFIIFSRFMHYHSLEVRMYGLLIMFFSFTLYEVYKVVFLNKFSWVWLGLCNALLIYTHYLGGLIVSFQFVVIVFFFYKFQKKDLIKICLSYLLTLLFISPVLVTFLSRINAVGKSGSWVIAPEVTELYGNIFRFFNTTLSFFLIAGFIFVLIIHSHIKKKFDFKSIFRDEKFVFLGLFFIINYLGFYIISLVYQPIFIDRYIVFVGVVLYLIPVFILFKLRPNKSSDILMFLCVLPMAFSTQFIPNNDREPDEVVRYVTSLLNKECTIAIAPPFYDLTFQYHYNRANFSFATKEENLYSIYNFSEMPEIKKNLILIDANSSFLYPTNSILNDAHEWGDLKENRVFKGGVAVYKFGKKRNEN